MGRSISFLAPIILGTSFFESAFCSLSLSFASFGASLACCRSLPAIWAPLPAWPNAGASFACWMRSFERSSCLRRSPMAASMLSLSLASRALTVVLVPSSPVAAALGADPELSRSMMRASSGFDRSSVPKFSLLTALRDITQSLALGRGLVV